MVSKSKGTQDKNLEVVEHALTRSERFIEENQKTIIGAIIVIVLIVGVFLGTKRFIINPKEKDAQSQMFAAEAYFEKDSFNLALNGDGNYLGFLDIIDEYKITKSAKLARYYAGISYLRLGQYQEAIDQLKQFKLKDALVLPISRGAIGDAYIELGQEKEAIKWYLEAGRISTNSFTTPIFLMKGAELLEQSGDLNQALSLYEEIKEKYPESEEGRKIDKYIARVKSAQK
ncbi:MAG: tetratricopeptide repeat protein [Bacteroidales bacterium]|jgi:tetratricopeptide (TPR) repeat protein|nr:tetratricopeptide repeat protein [Bacteroidales bacterium]MDD2570125.1 tetratricopeptide repeat protein [Bacteroidales bacterium]MDD2812029.1 tetratricopeptide repeat protein [Bacteroidales bacterium]MDD3385172.1 tetratricopeptide repeat protein [Bacteroidales bacterium]MDD3811046.1 tetratricopeptide repeat protein [Bacteroidales bacterium]